MIYPKIFGAGANEATAKGGAQRSLQGADKMLQCADDGVLISDLSLSFPRRRNLSCAFFRGL